MAGTILLYGFDDLLSILAVKGVAEQFGAEVKPVWREDYRKPVGSLVGRPTREGREGVFPGRLGGRMMVICGMDAQLEALLAGLRRTNIGPDCYKAVLTIYNQEWDGISLFTALQREQRTIEEQMKNKK